MLALFFMYLQGPFFSGGGVLCCKAYAANHRITRVHIWLIPWFPSLLPPPKTYNNNKKATTQNKNTPYAEQNVLHYAQNKFNYYDPIS